MILMVLNRALKFKYLNVPPNYMHDISCLFLAFAICYGSVNHKVMNVMWLIKSEITIIN